MSKTHAKTPSGQITQGYITTITILPQKLRIAR